MPSPPRAPEGHRTTAAADGALADPEIETTGTERLPYLAEVSEAMIDALDSGPSPSRLAALGRLTVTAVPLGGAHLPRRGRRSRRAGISPTRPGPSSGP